MIKDNPSHRSNGCSRCENLPEGFDASDRLYLWLPLEHSTTKLMKRLRSGGWDHGTGDGAIIVTPNRNLEDLLSLLSGTLSPTEMEDARCLLKSGPEKPTVRDIPKARSLRRLISSREHEWLSRMIEEDRLTSHFQPIVRTEKPGEIFGYEALLRGCDTGGGIVSPGEIFHAARESDLLFQTDLAARRTAIGTAIMHGIEQSLFVNFTPTSIYDPEFCLRSTVRVIDEAGIAHDKVVFEVTESENVEDAEHLLSIVEFYKDTGFKVALDDMGSGYSSLNLLHQLKPDFLKLDLQLIRGVNEDPYKATVARKILEMAQDLGTETIVEGVETDAELTWAQQNGADLAQGYFIARPASPPPKPQLSRA